IPRPRRPDPRRRTRPRIDHRPAATTVNDFAGRVAWVAGAARRPGIGRATAVQLARRGADVACVDIVTATPTDAESYRVSREALDATAAAVVAEGGRALALPVELADADAVDAAVAATVDAFGRV